MFSVHVVLNNLIGKWQSWNLPVNPIQFYGGAIHELIDRRIFNRFTPNLLKYIKNILNLGITKNGGDWARLRAVFLNILNVIEIFQCSIQFVSISDWC